MAKALSRFLAPLLVLAAIAAPNAPAQGLGKGGAPDPFGGALTPRAEEAEGPEVALRIVPSLEQAAPGSEIAFAIVLDHAEGWHTWPAAAQDVLPDDIAEFAIRTAIEVDGETPGWIESIGPVQWPEPYDVLAANPLGGDAITVKSYKGEAVAYVPAIVGADAEPGPREITFVVSYQACDDQICLMPMSEPLTAAVTVGESIAQGGDAALFAGFDVSVFQAMRSGDVGQTSAPDDGAGSRSSFFGIPIPSGAGVVGVLIVALLGAVGGFILNLTPCVLPVIPIKIMTISSHAANPGRALYLGAWMALGVIGFWAALGVPAAIFTGAADPSRLFGYWWVTLGLGLVIGAMGVGIMGAFEIRLPQKLYAINPNAETAWGSFLFGVMTGVLGLPCFGFVAGALLAGAATLPWTTVMTIFASIGVGMAAPYLVLSAKPSWVQKIPRTGPASELVKQVMGLLLLAAAVYFAGSGAIALASDVAGPASMPWWGKLVHWWAIALLALAAGGWLALRTFQITPSAGRRVVFALLGLLIGGAAVAYAVDTTIKKRNDYWVPFTPEVLADAQGDGRVVVLDFTAEWCLNCKALKAAVLEREPVKDELRSGEVVPMIADLTSTKAPGWDMLRDLGQTGIPLLVIYGPGLDEPWLSNAYTSDQVMSAIREARGVDRQAGLSPGS